MNSIIYVVVAVLWTYFVGWMLIGNALSKVVPPIVAKIIGLLIGLATAGSVYAFLF